MPTGLNSYDFVYNSSRVHYLESKMIGREKMNTLLELPGIRETESRLAEYGLDVTDACDELFRKLIKDAREEAFGSYSGKDAFLFLMYKYDCENIKASLKALIRDIEPDGMFVELGSIPAKDVYTAVRDKKYDILPQHMSQAVSQALVSYGKSGNPRVIDFIIDKACFEDMYECVKNYRVKFFTDYLDAYADMTNLIICLRLLTNRERNKEKILEDSLVPGGRIGKKEFVGAFADGEDMMIMLLERFGYDRAAKEIKNSDRTPTRYELAADNELIELIRKAGKGLFGPEVVSAYVLAKEFEVKNIRILLAGKRAGLSGDRIRERIRDSYV